MTTAITITPGEIADLSPDTYAFHPFDAMSEALVNLAGTVIANTNLSDRSKLSVSYTESGRDLVGIVAEGAEIQETATVFKHVEVPSVKLAVLKVASNEVINHNNTSSDTAGKIVTQAVQDLRDAADKAIFGHGAATSNGLVPFALNADFADLGTLGSNLDWLADGLANIVDGGGLERDSIIVTSPKGQAALLKLKDEANGNRPLIDTLSAASSYSVPNATAMTPSSIPVRNLAGIPILVSRNLAAPEGSGEELYIMDRPNLLVAATEVVVAKSDQADFKRDSQSFRGTMRIGWKLARPERVSRLMIPAQ